MKLVFRKYMEFENQAGNTAKVAALRQRVEEYLEKAFHQSSSSSDEEWLQLINSNQFHNRESNHISIPLLRWRDSQLGSFSLYPTITCDLWVCGDHLIIIGFEHRLSAIADILYPSASYIFVISELPHLQFPLPPITIIRVSQIQSWVVRTLLLVRSDRE